jgi:hypothetical protein
MENKMNPTDYVKMLAKEDGVEYKSDNLPPTKTIPKKDFTKFTIKDRWNLLKDNWNFSIKPMISEYKPFDFSYHYNYYDTHVLDIHTPKDENLDLLIPKVRTKTTPWSRLKDLVLGVYYILKSTITYVPLTATRYTNKPKSGSIMGFFFGKK